MCCTLVTPREAACASARFTACRRCIVGQRRQDLENVVHGSVFKRASGIALRVANDDSARRIRSLRGNAGQAQCDGIGQAHVAVIRLTNTGVSGAEGSISSLVGMLAGVHLVSSQSPPVTHSPLGVFFARSAMRRQIPRCAGGVVQLHLSSDGPPSTKCTCESLNPGSKISHRHR